jgi:prepilin peptidase CpaA
MAIQPGLAWFLSAVLIEAAIIDGIRLKVPNWLTYHLALGGLAWAAWSGGTHGLLWSLGGLATGLLLLLPLYAIGGMGAGDVKLLAGIGAWVGASVTLGAFACSAVVGGIIALIQMASSGDFLGHLARMKVLADEILEVRDPAELARRARERKPTMQLLPYGIPIAIGSLLYFAWSGLFA